MTIKVKSDKRLNVTTIFYSILLGRSIYLNTYFFSLKFLNLFSININVFYFLSKNFHFFIRNYWSFHYTTTVKHRYKKISKLFTYNSNFFILLFRRTLRQQYFFSKLI